MGTKKQKTLLRYAVVWNAVLVNPVDALGILPRKTPSIHVNTPNAPRYASSHIKRR